MQVFFFFSTYIRTKEWPKRIFFWSLDKAIDCGYSNGSFLEVPNTGTGVHGGHEKWIRSIINSLIELGLDKEELINDSQPVHSPKKSKSNHQSNQFRLHNADHLPVHVDGQVKRCALCHLNGVRKRTMYKCEKCNVNLCVIPCFKNYHTIKTLPTKARK